MGIHGNPNQNPPQPGEMEQMTESCMASPVVPAAVAVANGLNGLDHGIFPAARRGGRLAQMAEFSARMRCFKGAYEGKDWLPQPLGMSHCHSELENHKKFRIGI